MENEEKLTQAVLLLKKYCRNHVNCCNCKFAMSTYCAIGESAPKEWEVLTYED